MGSHIIKNYNHFKNLKHTAMKSPFYLATAENKKEIKCNKSKM